MPLKTYFSLTCCCETCGSTSEPFIGDWYMRSVRDAQLAGWFVIAEVSRAWCKDHEDDYRRDLGLPVFRKRVRAVAVIADSPETVTEAVVAS